MIGTAEAAKATPDGYTLLIISNTQTANELLIPTRNYELMRDFVAISPINESDLVIVAHPSVNAKNVQELIALAKAQPGKLNYASSGQGTPYHMAGELFKAMTGTNIVHVPHRNCRRGARQRARRPGRDHDRCGAGDGAEHRRGPGEGARHHRQEALERCCLMCRRWTKPA